MSPASLGNAMAVYTQTTKQYGVQLSAAISLIHDYFISLTIKPRRMPHDSDDRPLFSQRSKLNQWLLRRYKRHASPGGDMNQSHKTNQLLYRSVLSDPHGTGPSHEGIHRTVYGYDRKNYGYLRVLTGRNRNRIHFLMALYGTVTVTVSTLLSAAKILEGFALETEMVLQQHQSPDGFWFQTGALQGDCIEEELLDDSEAG
ncbi:hypothetical protein DFH08DRAFT_946225 [Mycena albidolilacea]|uniref:Uncharacterized protein n=1 Tax=Mycena albidolilacea TaxID=1033008 RepID=A0AAD6YXU7_9AGAR|nr:hypothetical protein DFH08DRAFT_946225 [Mycena albidolilacea]